MSMRARAALAITVAVVTFVGFLPVLSASFLNWDDNVNFLDNTAYRGLGPAQIRWAFTSALFGHYIPLTRLSWSVNYVLGGMNPLGYHLVNVLLHAGNATVFYFVARRILAAAVSQGAQEARREWFLCLAAAVAALVFGIHPLRAESVAWITGRADLLCGSFVLIAAWAYLRSVEGGGAARPPLILASAASLAAAILSKGVALPLPGALLLLDVYPLRRVSRLGWRALAREKLPLFLVSLVGAVVVVLAVRRGAIFNRADEFGPIARVAVAGYSFCVYLFRFIWPASLSPLYEMPTRIGLLEPRFGFTLLASLVVTAALIGLRRRWPAGLAVWAFSALMLAPTSIALRSGADLAPDRYSYLSGLGFAALAGGGVVMLARLCRRARVGRRILAAGAGLLAVSAIAALASVTWGQAKIWHDDETLWRHAVRLDPASPSATSNLGSALRAQGRLDEAVEQSTRALLLKPDFPEPQVNLGLVRLRQGKATDAEGHFRRALQLKPRSGPARTGLASALEAQGRFDEAIEQLRGALRFEPQSAATHNQLGVVLARRGRVADALTEFSEAVRIDPGSAQAQNNLGLALAQSGRLAEAAGHFGAAIRSEPDYQEARVNLEHTLRLLREGAAR
jgi:protein O-mannosyl-transferase